MGRHLFLALALLSFAVCATAQTMDTTEVTMHDGSRMADAGKALMFTGASFAMTGVVTMIAGTIDVMNHTDPSAPTTPMHPLIAMGAGAIGAAFALIGLPFYLAGKDRMNSYGVTFMNIGDYAEPGVAGMVELGSSLLVCLDLDALAGYNFNGRFFLGGGLGYKLLLVDSSERNSLALPVYAHARYTFGDKKVSPYAGMSAGYDILFRTPYLGFDFGTRVRSLERRERGSSWWFGTKCEMMGSKGMFLSVKIGKSF